MMSRNQSRTSFLAALFAFVALPAVALGQEAPETPEAPAPECTLTLEPTALAAGAPAQQVQATLSADVGAIDGVQVQDGSGLQIALVDPTGVTLAVDASAANPGEWQIDALSGGSAVCSGTVRVDAGEQPGA